MKRVLLILTAYFSFTASYSTHAQVNEDELGAWYMYFFSISPENGQFGLQGDIQLRNWDFGSDLEQLLLRGGVTYSPKDADILFTLGYGNITSGTPGSENRSTSTESRIYQEALFPSRFGNRFYLNHRFRFEQRFVESQDFRTRFRYNLFVNIPLNKPNMESKTLYLATYNELFINGERSIGDNREVEIFDRNRSYAALGYVVKNGMKVQLGIMNQITDSWGKKQLQLSFHQKF